MRAKERSYNWRSTTIEEERFKAGSQPSVILLLIAIFGEEGQGDTKLKIIIKKRQEIEEDY